MKAIFAILALAFTFQTASATSIMGSALSYQSQAVYPGGTSHELTIYMNGMVVDGDITARPPFRNVRQVAQLPAHQMDRIFRLIRRATPAVTRFEPSGVKCFAPASHIEKFRADNNMLTLREGAACNGGYTVNVRLPARRLVNLLTNLERAIHQGLSPVMVEAQVEAALN